MASFNPEPPDPDDLRDQQIRELLARTARLEGADEPVATDYRNRLDERMARIALEAGRVAVAEAKGRLTDQEIAELRALVQHDARVRWLWSTTRAWALAIAAVVAAVTVGIDALRTMVRNLVN